MVKRRGCLYRHIVLFDQKKLQRACLHRTERNVRGEYVFHWFGDHFQAYAFINRFNLTALNNYRPSGIEIGGCYSNML